MHRLRYAVSILLSACLWATLKPILGFLDDAMTERGRELFVQSLPQTILLCIVFFVPLSALMHWFWAATVLRVDGIRFWLLPFKTLPSAYACGSLLLLPFFVIHEGLSLRPDHIAGLLYMFVAYAFVLLVSKIWIMYPLAIANQYIICALLRNK